MPNVPITPERCANSVFLPLEPAFQKFPLEDLFSHSDLIILYNEAILYLNCYLSFCARPIGRLWAMQRINIAS